MGCGEETIVISLMVPAAHRVNVDIRLVSLEILAGFCKQSIH